MFFAWKYVFLVWQICAAGVDEIYAWEIVLSSYFLSSQMLADGDGVVGPPFYCAIICNYEALNSGHGADACEDAT